MFFFLLVISQVVVGLVFFLGSNDQSFGFLIRRLAYYGVEPDSVLSDENLGDVLALLLPGSLPQIAYCNDLVPPTG